MSTYFYKYRRYFSNTYNYIVIIICCQKQYINAIIYFNYLIKQKIKLFYIEINTKIDNNIVILTIVFGFELRLDELVGLLLTDGSTLGLLLGF